LNPATPFILLPGLDGTGELFGPLLSAVPPAYAPQVVSYPRDQVLGYDALFVLVCRRLAALSIDAPAVLLGESFSAPLAVRYAAEFPERMRSLVLCASFVRSPVPRWLLPLVRDFLFRRRSTRAELRLTHAGWDAPDELLGLLASAIDSVDPRVMAERVRQVMRVDCADALAKVKAPVLYLAASRDRIVRRASARRVRAVRPGVVVRTLDAPHMLLQRRPAEAWHEIERFVTGPDPFAG
jgi:pimeloyl-ACP methyl ester carboxylesterase